MPSESNGSDVGDDITLLYIYTSLFAKKGKGKETYYGSERFSGNGKYVEPTTHEINHSPCSNIFFFVLKSHLHSTGLRQNNFLLIRIKSRFSV